MHMKKEMKQFEMGEANKHGEDAVRNACKLVGPYDNARVRRPQDIKNDPWGFSTPHHYVDHYRFDTEKPKGE